MSKSVLGIVTTVVGVALLAIPGIGEAIGLPMIIAGISSASVIGLGLVVVGGLLSAPAAPKALTDASTVGRLQATFITTEPRKIVFGHTAMGNDVRYQAYSGANQEYLEMIVVHASHEVHSIDELWLDNEKAWTSSGGVQGRFSGYLTVTTRTLGTSSNGIAIDGTWTVHCTLTGCAYTHLQFKLTGNDSNATSPFSSGVTSRMTWRGKGAKIFDPRLDDTVTGGSGAMRADDQSTWAWDDDASRNPALQELWYELGWKINGKLAVGKGVPPARLDLASYAVAANACDETVALAAGGTEPRYRSDAVVSEGDDPGAVRDNLCATMNAVLRDAGGKLALTVIHDDLASPVTPYGKTAFDEDDVIGDLTWEQTPDLSSTFNIVRGQMTDASDQGLYQQVDFPEVVLASNDGIDRIDTIQLPFVQSNGQAQRLAKQRLQRAQYQGRLTFSGKPTFWGLSLGDVFAFSHSAFGWNEKLFRCAGQTISRTGETQVVAVEENSAIYAWDAEEAPAVVAGTPIVYDPLNHPIVRGIGDAYNRYIDAPAQSLTFKYAYDLTPEDGEFPRDIVFNLRDSNGLVTTGIGWSGEVLIGGFSDTYDASSGSFGMGSGESADLTITSLEAALVSIQVTATFDGKDYVKTVQLTKDVAAPPVTVPPSGGGTGGGTSGTGTLFTKESGFAGILDTTWTDVTGAMTATPDATAVNVNVALDAVPAGGTGSWTVECKVMRDISGTPSQIGTVQSKTSRNSASLGPDAASFAFSVTDSGLTSGTPYTWRVYMRLASGSEAHNVVGNDGVTVTA